MRMRGQASTEYLVAAVFCFFLLFGRIGDQPSSVADQLLTALKNIQSNYSLGMSVVSYHEPDESNDEGEDEQLPGCDYLPSSLCRK